MTGATQSFNNSSDLDEKKRVNEALRSAAIQGDVRRMQRFLDQGADIEYPDVNRIPPLYWAATGQHEEATRFLLDKGAKVDGGIAANQPDTALIQNCGSDNGIPMARLLLSYHADINAQNHAGRTALNEALQFEQEGAALFLIEEGANPNIPDKEGTTPIMAALKKNQRVAALSLVNNGADVDNVTLYNETIRANAAKKGWSEVVQAISDVAQRREDERVKKINDARDAFDAELEASPVLQHRMPVGRPLALKSSR